MGSILSGKNMSVNASSASGVYAFEINQEHYPAWQVGGNQAGAVARAEGNFEWYGWFMANGHTPLLWVGDQFAFTCAPSQTGSLAVSGTALCVGLEIICDNRNPDEPVPLYHRVLFGPAGVLSYGVSSPTDSGTPAIYPPKGICAYYGSSIPRTKYQKLRIFDKAPVRTTDCTENGQIIWAAGELDAEYEWWINTDDPDDFPLLSADPVNGRMNVTDTEYWDLNWLRLTEYPKPWSASRRPPKVVDAKFKAAWTGYNGTTQGYIKNPAGATKWPAA